jgi:hypothetical protein
MSTPANASGGMVERSITGEDLIAELDRLAVGRGALPTVLWPVAGLVVCAARPSCVAAAVAEAGLVTDEHRAGGEAVTVRASRRWVG